MKLSNKPNIAAGIVLLLVAAFFSISLILQALDFGSFGPGRENLLYQLGSMLTSVYGFSSILIPVFLFYAAISCFASRWTARKSMQLLTAVVPFFTAVGIEKVCRMIIEHSMNTLSEQGTDSFAALKVGLTAVIGVMLVIIEILSAGMLADKISGVSTNGKKSGGRRTVKIPDGQNDASFEDINTSEYDADEETVFDGADFSVTEFSDGSNGSGVQEELSEKDASVSDEPYSDGNLDAWDKGAGDYDETAASETVAEDPYSLASLEETSSPAQADETVQAHSPERSGTKKDDPFAGVFDDIPEEDEIPENPASLITQEEYAALTDFSDENEDSGDDDTSDEIEWPEEDEIKAKAGNTFQAETVVDEDINAESEGDAGGTEETSVFENTEEKEEPFTVPDHEEISLEENPFEDFSDANGDEGNLAEEVPSASDTAATLDPDFFDIDMNEETPEEEEEEAALEGRTGGFEANGKGAENDEDAPYETEERVEEVNPFETPETSLSAEVFDDMEKEIRDELKGKKFAFTEPEQQSDFDSQEMPENKISDSLPAQNPAPSSRARAKGPYKIPTSLLEEYENDQYWIIDEQTKADSLKLKETLNQFNIEAEIIGIKKGPVVTMFELAPAPGVKLSKIVTLQDNIALSLAASSVRIVAPIPGRAAVGIEVPNKHRSIVSFREMIEQDLPEYNKMAIPVILGKDILGKAQLLDLVKTPHLLIAGATGAGKSVCVNSMILSILYKRSPQQVKLILVDPKVVELKLYNDIPHLLTPVITEPKRALQSLQYCLCEMERRYALLDGMGVRDISSYNRRIEERNICTEKLPYIVVIIDEFADLMATTGKELESTIARLAAMSRAVGIHLVLATQRPSIDVITGLIKANIPTRIAFMVASKMDSRIIIDQVGAEMLLGKGDMLYASAVDPFPVRIQGTFVSDNDVEKVVEYVKSYGEPEYIDDEIFVDDDDVDLGPSLFNEGADPLYDQALDIVIQAGKASASYIQRRLKIGYNRAARLVEEMEERGIVGPANGSKPREVIHIPS